MAISFASAYLNEFLFIGASSSDPAEAGDIEAGGDEDVGDAEDDNEVAVVSPSRFVVVVLGLGSVKLTFC